MCAFVTYYAVIEMACEGRVAVALVKCFEWFQMVILTCSTKIIKRQKVSGSQTDLGR